MRRDVETDCPQDCPDRSPTCHGECEKYLAAWNKRKAENNAAILRAKADEYKYEMLRQTKQRGGLSLNHLRPGRRKPR